MDDKELVLDDEDSQRAVVVKAQKILAGTYKESQSVVDREKMLSDFHPKMLVRVMQVHPNSL